ncbi:unnamed protein product, partial [Nesidiocoris tenuis]
MAEAQHNEMTNNFAKLVARFPIPHQDMENLLTNEEGNTTNQVMNLAVQRKVPNYLESLINDVPPFKTDDPDAIIGFLEALYDVQLTADEYFEDIVKRMAATKDSKNLKRLINDSKGGPEQPRQLAAVLTEIPELDVDLCEAQRQDPKLRDIIEALQRNEPNANYVLRDGKLFFKTSKGCLRAVVPESLRNAIFRYYHSSPIGAHQGITKTASKIASSFHFPKLLSYLRENIGSCLTCQKSKYDQSRKKGQLSSRVYTHPGEALFIDIAGELPASHRDRYKYILVCMDAFTRFTFFIPLRQATAKSVTEAIERVIFKHFGYWESLHSDNASIFRSG